MQNTHTHKISKSKDTSLIRLDICKVGLVFKISLSPETFILAKAELSKTVWLLKTPALTSALKVRLNNSPRIVILTGSSKRKLFQGPRDKNHLVFFKDENPKGELLGCMGQVFKRETNATLEFLPHRAAIVCPCVRFCSEFASKTKQKKLQANISLAGLSC